MKHKLTLLDISEMLGACYAYQEVGHNKVRADTEDIIEIIERLLKFEMENQEKQ